MGADSSGLHEEENCRSHHGDGDDPEGDGNSVVWGDIVRWSLNTLVIAEEKGLTSANVDSMIGSTNDPEVLV
jgi:hypothetical protein